MWFHQVLCWTYHLDLPDFQASKVTICEPLWFLAVWISQHHVYQRCVNYLVDLKGSMVRYASLIAAKMLRVVTDKAKWQSMHIECIGVSIIKNPLLFDLCIVIFHLIFLKSFLVAKLESFFFTETSASW